MRLPASGRIERTPTGWRANRPGAPGSPNCRREAPCAEITLADVTANLKRIAQAAEEEGGAPGLSVARAAWMDVAKLNRLVVDNSENVKATTSSAMSP